MRIFAVAFYLPETTFYMEQTNFDVFISYSSKNKQLADAMCHALEQHKIKCWIAPRNVQPGNPYAREIINGIENSKLMVLVFTHDADESEHVANELEMAFEHKKIIIPYVAENVPMSKEFSYYLKRKHWLNAYPNPEESFQELIKVVFNVLGGSGISEFTETQQDKSSNQNTTSKGALIRVHSDMECRIERFDEKLGITAAGQYFVIRLPKGNHILKFISMQDDCDRLTMTYTVEDVEIEDFIEVALKPIREARLGKHMNEFANSVPINKANFPDASFRNYLLEQDYGKDRILTDEAITKITFLDVREKGIENLKGIEWFIELIELNCGSNKLTLLEMSKNTKLAKLHCSDNQLTTLDVSMNTELEYLDCSENQLEALDVSKNAKLQYMDSAINRLTELDVSKNTELKELYCGSNQLTTLEVLSNLELKELSCHSNRLAMLDVSKNTHLEKLNCSKNQLTALHISGNAHLEKLSCHSNLLPALDVSKNAELTELYCGENQLSALDVSKNIKLKVLYCYNNQLTTLNVSGNAYLEKLSCGENQLTTLDVLKNARLEKLNCFGNQLTTLDVSNNIKLKKLVCGNNQLTSLNVLKNTELKEIYYDEAKLTPIDFSNNKNLKVIN